jgi:hypothetical protein
VEIWLSGVNKLVSNMDIRFSEYMEALQYHGRLSLRQTGKLIDYEMVVEVGFRGDGERAELSGARHSGGERAVSTIMYLMALQQMTSAPFRVVDEINQGMDDRNERLVFSRIVQSCCRDAQTLKIEKEQDGLKEGPVIKASPSFSRASMSSSSGSSTPIELIKREQRQHSQYFLVSPKLLQGLKALDNDDVTVLLVLNGPGLNSVPSNGSSSRGHKRSGNSGPFFFERFINSLKRKFGVTQTSENRYNIDSQGIKYDSDCDEYVSSSRVKLEAQALEKVSNANSKRRALEDISRKSSDEANVSRNAIVWAGAQASPLIVKAEPGLKVLPPATSGTKPQPIVIDISMDDDDNSSIVAVGSRNGTAMNGSHVGIDLVSGRKRRAGRNNIENAHVIDLC